LWFTQDLLFFAELAGLPPQQPLADKTATCAQRCFVVCVPKALPVNILRQVFCRAGDLIDVYMLPNKNCGYAKYATEEGAKKAMSLLHGLEFMGTKLKVRKYTIKLLVFLFATYSFFVGP
jgi:hypothetical protein